VGSKEEVESWVKQELADWQKDILFEVSQGKTLSNEQLTNIFDKLLDYELSNTDKSNDQNIKKYPKTLNLEIANSPPNRVSLIELSNIKGVNKISEESLLKFAESGLTIIYGSNGSGKSGYARLLRTLCRSQMVPPAIIPNRYKSESPPVSASIKLCIDGNTTEIFEWFNRSNFDHELRNILVFDNEVANIYVNNANKIGFMPHELNVLNLLVSNMDALTEIASKRKSQIEVEKGQLYQNLQGDTNSFIETLLSKIDSKTTERKIRSTFELKEEYQDHLNFLIAEKNKEPFSPDKVVSMVEWLDKLTSQFEKLISYIKSNNKITDKLKMQKALKEKIANGAASLFSDETLNGIGTEIWKVMWDAARDFSTNQAYLDEEFPVVSTDVSEKHCVLCLQVLDPIASERLKKFDAFVSDKLSIEYAKASETLKGIKDEIKEAIDSIQSSIDAPVLFDFARFDLTKGLIQNELVKIRNCLRAIFKSEFDNEKCNHFDILDAFKNAKTKLEGMVGNDADVSAKEVRERDLEIGELSAKIALGKQIDTLVRYLIAIKKINAISNINKGFGSAKVSNKFKELAGKYITDNASMIFAEELKHLKISLPIKFNSKVSKATATFEPLLNFENQTKKELPSKILSEGEQKALALANFFTGIRVENHQHAIVFDDPVSSLDRVKSGLVAQRIAHESTIRQVILFTHDIRFVRELQNCNVSPKITQIMSNKSASGLIDKGGFLSQAGKIESRINGLKGEFSSIRKLYESSITRYSEGTQNILTQLYKVYESMIEQTLFAGVVTRLNEDIAIKKLRYVGVSDNIWRPLNLELEKLNDYRHSNSDSSIKDAPEPDEIEKILENASTLFENIKQYNDKTQKSRENTPKTDRMFTDFNNIL